MPVLELTHGINRYHYMNFNDQLEAEIERLRKEGIHLDIEDRSVQSDLRREESQNTETENRG